jgi:DNA-directed RNA polymerase subunit D
MVQMKIVEESDDGTRIKVHMLETDRAFVNAIRRTLISDVPKMAITRVRFELGTTQDGATGESFESINALPDELIAHRLAMLPIPTYLDEFHFPDECPDCAEIVEAERGCPRCQVLFHCSVRGTVEGVWLRAGDLNVLGDEKLQIPEVYQSTQLTKLFKGQYIEFYAYATLGRGRDHSKWCPVAAVTFIPRQVGRLNNKSKSKLLWNLNLGITAKDFGKDGVLDDFSKVEELKRNLHHVGEGTAIVEDFADAVALEDIPGEFILGFETDGSLSARVALQEAFKVLEASLDSLNGDLTAAL